MITAIKKQIPLLTPSALITEIPASTHLLERIEQHRTTLKNIMTGKDPRLAVIVGPCSIHDAQAAIEYATLLKKAAEQFADSLFIVMRVYFEKPRTTVGWKGYISDPFLNGQFDFDSGLKLARKLLIELAEMNVPAATEFLNPFIPQYIGDLISWCAIGARTTESQIHRELASSLAMPVGFKNTTDGNIKIAIEAVDTARQPHHFLSISQSGMPTVFATNGNRYCHVILRGSNDQPNFADSFVKCTLQNLKEANLIPRLMIDCSHGNSLKNAGNQVYAVKSVIEQLRQGSNSIFGLMLESNLVAGKQKPGNVNNLEYGKSITDECIAWHDTLPLLAKLAEENLVSI